MKMYICIFRGFRLSFQLSRINLQNLTMWFGGSARKPDQIVSDWLLQKHRTRSIGDERWVITCHTSPSPHTKSQSLSSHQTPEVLVNSLNITPAQKWAVVEEGIWLEKYVMRLFPPPPPSQFFPPFLPLSLLPSTGLGALAMRGGLSTCC